MIIFLINRSRMKRVLRNGCTPLTNVHGADDISDLSSSNLFHLIIDVSELYYKR